jgi:hypothetical protein
VQRSGVIPLEYKNPSVPCKAKRGLGAVKPEVFDHFDFNYALFIFTFVKFRK